MASNTLATRRGRNGGKETGMTTFREMIGRVIHAIPVKTRLRHTTIDKTISEYEFWDQLRRGKARGYALAGLFCKPLTEIVAGHVMGIGTSAQLVPNEDYSDDGVEYTNKLLGRFLNRMSGQLITMLVDLYGLGDQYAILNSDGTISLPSPDTVDPEYDPLDYRSLIKLTVITRLDDYEVKDEYRAEGRTVTITWLKPRDGQKAGHSEITEYENLLGRLPAVHFANDRSANELYGRPIYEGLLRLLSRYDDLMEKALDGGELMGMPVPVVEGLEDMTQVEQDNDPEEPETYFDIDGNEVPRSTINFETRAMILLGKGARFQFATPPTGYSEDIRRMLELLFYLLMDYTRVPEYLWGGAVASSKASTETQEPPFQTFVEGRRLMLEGEGSDDLLDLQASGGVLELLELWLLWRRLTDPQIIVGPVQMKWTKMGNIDLEIRLKWTDFLKRMGLITGVETVSQSGLVDDPEAAVEAAQQEAEEANPQAQAQDELMAAIRGLQGGAEEPPPGEDQGDQVDQAEEQQAA